MHVKVQILRGPFCSKKAMKHVEQDNILESLATIRYENYLIGKKGDFQYCYAA